MLRLRVVIALNHRRLAFLAENQRASGPLSHSLFKLTPRCDRQYIKSVALAPLTYLPRGMPQTVWRTPILAPGRAAMRAELQKEEP